MAITRTREDIIRAYKVYKNMDLFKKHVTLEDANICTLIGTFIALYGGLSMQELECLFPGSKSCIKDVVKKGIYKYGIFNFNGNLVLGRESLTGKISKGILSFSSSFEGELLSRTRTVNVNNPKLKAFSALLSNISSHVHIMQDNIEGSNSKFILRHVHALFTALVNRNLYSGSTYAQNLTKLGYMRAANGDVELNKRAVMFNKEPKFELRAV